jgi:hypothetical protein
LKALTLYNRGRESIQAELRANRASVSGSLLNCPDTGDSPKSEPGVAAAFGKWEEFAGKLFISRFNDKSGHGLDSSKLGEKYPASMSVTAVPSKSQSVELGLRSRSSRSDLVLKAD